jgi:translation initiation factor 3 subunit B
LRSFATEASPASDQQRTAGNATLKIDWPIFKWSHDDKYLARLGNGAISVYETPSMGLLNKQSIKVDQVQGFAWSPKDPILAFWTPDLWEYPSPSHIDEDSYP